MRDERAIRSVPKPAIALLLFGFLFQFIWHDTRPPLEAKAEDLPAPPSLEHLRVLSFGDPETLARLLMLWLQAFDNQPGISIPFRDLDYGKVAGWLERILQLDPRGQYPLLAASRLYGEVPDKGKQRFILGFVYQQFLKDPNRRWPWLAHAVYIAKHRLKDFPLALKYAEALASHATGRDVPHWAQQMRIFVLEEMGETEAAKVLLGGLLESGTITDPHEMYFLSERLKQLESSAAPSGSSD